MKAGGGQAVGPGYPWQLVRGGGFRENLRLQLVCVGLSAEQGGGFRENLRLQLVCVRLSAEQGGLLV